MDELFTEAQRQLTICNACRYCEGYCAVFPALERRTLLEAGDITHLANLCHDCRACFHACMYAPPHEFAVNPPEILSRVRLASYRAYARPRACRLLRGPARRAAAARPWLRPPGSRGWWWRSSGHRGDRRALGPTGGPTGHLLPGAAGDRALPCVWSVALLLRAAGRYWRGHAGRWAG